MNYKLISVILISIMFYVMIIPANNISDDYFEYSTISIKSCNYLESVQDFTQHKFLVNISSNCILSNSSFTMADRYHNMDFPITLHHSFERYITIKFEVYEILGNEYFLCDLDEKNGTGSTEIIYDTYTGHWTGDDYIGDKSGYGRFNGCDDESFYENQRDFEIIFSININDPDDDKIPIWFEENIYGTDPYFDNSNDDFDEDLIPLYWEYKWGYDPFSYDEHMQIDPDADGLMNYEEFLVSEWGSDPYRDDMFMELDQMELGPNGEGLFVPKGSLIMVYQTYAKRNIVYHVDDGCMGGGEILPFEPIVWMGEEKQYYRNHFLNNDNDNWRRGVFRYALFVNDHFPIRGMEFPGEHSILLFFKPGLNSFVISTKAFNDPRNLTYACIILHELGHTMGPCMGRPLGCDNQLMRFPLSFQNILFSNYKSVMNYKYSNSLLDYSDGTHGFGDYDDWGKMDLAHFKPRGAQ
ncbi:MAG: hypothetical protein DRN27_02515 [Thermoplasmata archaeon]|nr:MAG: hypothetical protein DRN27_02515 [Thermoplasmata archaeon]